MTANQARARIRILRDGAERGLDVGAALVTIGRAAGQSLRLVEDGVAGEHAALHLGERWEVEARGGAVVVEGARIAAGARAPLPRGGRLSIGGWTLVVEDAPRGTEASGAARTASLARELVRDLLGGEEQVGPVLEIEAGPSAGQSLPLPPPPSRLVIGRGDGATVLVLDADLSRQHIGFDRGWDGVRVVDLGSKNGTRVEGVAAPVEPPGVLLRDGDRIAAGATVLRYRDPAEEFLRALEEPAAPEPTSATPPPALAPSPARPPVPSLVPVIAAAAIAVAAVVALVLLLV